MLNAIHEDPWFASLLRFPRNEPRNLTKYLGEWPEISSSQLSLTVSSSVKQGMYLFTVTGIGGMPAITRTATATLGQGQPVSANLPSSLTVGETTEVSQQILTASTR